MEEPVYKKDYKRAKDRLGKYEKRIFLYVAEKLKYPENWEYLPTTITNSAIFFRLKEHQFIQIDGLWKEIRFKNKTISFSKRIFSYKPGRLDRFLFEKLLKKIARYYGIKEKMKNIKNTTHEMQDFLQSIN